MPTRPMILLAPILLALLLALVAGPSAAAPDVNVDQTTSTWRLGWWLFGWWTGLGLLLLGIVLIAAEAVLPTLGLLGVGGLVALAAGLLILADGTAVAADVADVSQTTAIGVAVVLLVYLVIAGAVVRRAWRHRVATGDPALIGSDGIVVAWRGRTGMIRVCGELWQARSDAPLPSWTDAAAATDARAADGSGRSVRVVGRRGLVLRVEPAPAPAPATSAPTARPKDRS